MTLCRPCSMPLLADLDLCLGLCCPRGGWGGGHAEATRPAPLC